VKTYQQFRLAMRVRESSNRYAIKNSLGFLGAYQFGGPRLVDLGLASSSKKNVISWKFPWTENIFLTSPELQDACFDLHVIQLKLRIMRLYKELPQGFDMSGSIAVCHLLGIGGLNKLIEGTDSADANGTTATKYRDHFKGYAIP